RRKPRGAQLVVVGTPAGPLHVVNWHLGLSERERHYQAGHLLHHPLFHEAAHLPTIIVGDTNDWRNKLSKYRFREHHFEQATAPVKQYRSFPAFFAVASLDKVYHRGAVAVDRVTVVQSKLARKASDHLPLVIDFGLKAD